MTLLIATGGGDRAKEPFITALLSFLSEDIMEIRTEFCLAGINENSERLIPQRDQSFANALHKIKKDNKFNHEKISLLFYFSLLLGSFICDRLVNF